MQYSINDAFQWKLRVFQSLVTHHVWWCTDLSKRPILQQLQSSSLFCSRCYLGLISIRRVNNSMHSCATFSSTIQTHARPCVGTSNVVRSTFQISKPGLGSSAGSWAIVRGSYFVFNWNVDLSIKSVRISSSRSLSRSLFVFYAFSLLLFFPLITSFLKFRIPSWRQLATR